MPAGLNAAEPATLADALQARLVAPVRHLTQGSIRSYRRALAAEQDIVLFANQDAAPATLEIALTVGQPMWWFDALSGAAWPAESADGRLSLALRGFESRFLRDPRALATYEEEIRQSGLLEHVRQKRKEYDALVGSSAGGGGYTPGGIGLAERTYLYAIMRTLKPRVAVETGVANGFSTAFALLALERNGEGHLYSVDFPREVGRDADEGFYQGIGKAGIPPESTSGWLIPEHLRGRWTLRLGPSSR